MSTRVWTCCLLALRWFPVLCRGGLVTKTTTTPRLVVLIPAYNEADRIGPTIESYRTFLARRKQREEGGGGGTTTSPPSWECEILVVDDGSSDGTSRTVEERSAAEGVPVRCVRLSSNQGKGGALSRGIRHIAEEAGRRRTSSEDDPTLVLTQDADGSGDLKYLDQMCSELQSLVGSGTAASDGGGWDAMALVTGNRNYDLLSPRGVTRWGFQTCVSIIMGGLGVRDSQCGCKLMTLPAASLLYEDLNLKGWAHDVEVLYRAKSLGVPVAQVSIDWSDKDGSKVVDRKSVV